MAQDAYYLRHFAAAYAAAIDKCDPGDAGAQADLQHMLHGLHDELRLHGSLAAQWGIDLQRFKEPSKATKSYTDFLNAVADHPEVQ
jgi:thiaminase